MIKNPFALIAERVRKSGDTMTGGLNIARTNTTTSTIHSTLELGNNTPNGTAGCTYGRLILRSNDGYGARIMARNLTAQRDYDFPDKGGTVALTSDITTDSTNTDVAWGSSASINRGNANSMLITGGRQGYGFQVFIPKDANEYVILSNVNSTLTSVTVTSSAVTIGIASSGFGTKCIVNALKFN